MEKAALSLLVSTVSPFINFLGNKAASYFGGDITPQEVRKLQNIILPTIQTVIDAAEAIPTDNLKPWLMDLKAAVLEAEDVLDLCEYKNIKNKVSGRPDSLNKLIAKTKEFSRFVLPKTALRNSLEKLQESADNAKEFLDLIRYVPPRDTKRQQSTAAAVTVSVPSSPVFGRDEERDDLIDMLISGHDHESSSTSNIITQHALYGVGGAGKTTLAQYVYNDERVEGHFDTRMWVHVPRNLDVRRVTKEIIESAGQGTDISNLDALQKKLEQLLNSKRFLLIIDDVWCEDRGEWDKLLVPLNKSGKVGSRILITTRMERVALTLGVKIENIRSLKELRPEDCWSILKHYAFGDVNKAIQDQDLAATGKKIAYKLKNSPLAARLVGSLLVRNVDVGAWNKFLKEDLLGGTLDNLQWSFRYLPLHLQSCFAFCSLYPKGYSFSKDALARLWVAEGFVVASEKDGLTAVEKGQQYFDELMSCSFFQLDLAWYSPGLYIIHDLLHDLAEEVSKGHYFRIEGESPADIPPTVVHLSIVGKLPMSSLNTLELVHLRTFMHISSESIYDPRNTITEDMLEMLAKHRMLRVIHLRSSIDKPSSSIDKLKHLRYLKVPGVKELPESLGRLYHLQFLILKHHDIERAPKRLNNLVNLQHLISGNEKGIRVPEIGRLTMLQTLSFYYVETSKGYGIEQLKNLQQLRGSLTIKGLENVKSKTNAIEARLNQKKHLEELILVWESKTNTDDKADEEVLEGLKLPPNLKKLTIRGYRGCPMMGSLPNLPASLKELDVHDCVILPSLHENLEELPSLERLSIRRCPMMGSLPNLPASLKEMDVVGCAILPSLAENLEELPSLEGLQIHGCPMMGSLPNLPASLKELDVIGSAILPSLPENLEELPFLELLRIRECPMMGSLPNLPASLKELEVDGCAILPSLPENLEELPSLERLQIHGCPMMGSLPNLPASLKAMYVGGCDILPSLPENLEELPSLELLFIHGCPMMGSLPNMPASLKNLNVGDCDILPSLPENLEELPSLEELSIRRCPMMGSLPKLPASLPNMPASLKALNVGDCDILPYFPENLEELPSLEELSIRRCPMMGSLPKMPASLVRLDVVDCDILEEMYGEGGPLRVTRLITSPASL